MINFRFHIASLIAIFLALALGVVMGSTVVQRAIVENLRDRIDKVSAKADRQRDDNDKLRSEIGHLNDYAEQSAPYAVSGQLTDQAVAIVAERGLDESTVQSQLALLRAAGARAPGILWLDGAWNLPDNATANALRTAIGSTTRSTRVLRTEALNALALRVAQGPRPAGEPDVLDGLAKGGFVTLEGLGNEDVAAATWPEAGARMLLLGGTQSSITAPGATRDLTRALVNANAPTVVGELYVDGDNAPDRGEWLAPIRSDDQLKTAVSTVDDVDLVQGRVASALALADLARGVVGHYGYGAGASSTVPPAPVPAG